MGELYELNRGLLATLARRYRGRDLVVSDEDLMQAGFLGLVAAVDAWEPERGAWSNIATLCVKRAMREALGIHTTRQRAHLGAVSLDEPIPGSGDGDTTRADLLADESLIDAIEVSIQSERAAAVRAAVGRLESRWRGVIERRFMEGRTIDQTGRELGINPNEVRSAQTRALKDLQKDRQLLQELDDEMEARAYRHKGATAFNTEWTSVTEAAALWRIERREQL